MNRPIRRPQRANRLLSAIKQELIVGVTATLGTFGLFWIVRILIASEAMISFDTSVSIFFYSLRTPLATEIMMFFSFLGVQITIVLFLIAVLILLKKHHRNDVLLLSTILILGGIVNVFLKASIQRPRPSLSPLWGISNDYSFPSSHAMNSFLFFAAASYIIFHITRNRTASSIVTVVSIVLVAMVGISRIYLGVHYPSDVIAGYLAGLAWFCAVLTIEKAYFLVTLLLSENKIQKELLSRKGRK